MSNCKNCNVELTSENVKLRGGSVNYTFCEKCYLEKQRWAVTKYRFGITKEQYYALFKAQNGVCKICAEAVINENDRLNIDHDHETGKIRGLLCRRCNSSLGRWNEDINRFIDAIAYLNEHRNIAN